MFEYFIFIVIKSTVYKELSTLKLIDKVMANNTKQALMKAEENLSSDLLHAGIDDSKMIAWNCARDCDKGDNWSKDTPNVKEYNNIEDAMTDITDELKNIAHGRHPKCFE